MGGCRPIPPILPQNTLGKTSIEMPDPAPRRNNIPLPGFCRSRRCLLPQCCPILTLDLPPMGLWGCTRDHWRHGSCRFFGTVMVLAVGLQTATHAQTPLSRAPQPSAATACRFESVGEGTVSGVVDGRSFVLTDGREIRLAGLEVPTVRPGEVSSPSDAGHASRTKLESILAGATVKLS